MPAACSHTGWDSEALKFPPACPAPGPLAVGHKLRVQPRADFDNFNSQEYLEGLRYVLHGWPIGFLQALGWSSELATGW